MGWQVEAAPWSQSMCGFIYPLVVRGPNRERMTEPVTFTLVEAAELLNCHKETLRREIKAGNLRAAKIGKEYRVSKTELENYWAERGGGALFEDSPRRPAGPRKDEKKVPGQEQLKLPT